MWIWGGFSVSQATLNRFYSFHFLVPFAIAICALVHLIFLHDKGSTNPLGAVFHGAKVTFHPYFTWKDIVGFIAVGLVFLAVVFLSPNFFTDPENFIEANPIVTPTHIQPEWYFLFAYAILRSIPSKIGGVVALACSVLFFYLFPPLGRVKPQSGTAFNMPRQVLFWIFVVVFILLTWLGACPVEAPYMALAQPATALYFILPLTIFTSNYLWSRLY